MLRAGLPVQSIKGDQQARSLWLIYLTHIQKACPGQEVRNSILLYLH